MIAMRGDGGAEPGEPGDAASAGAPWVDGERFPVCVQAPAGWWRLRPAASPDQAGPWFVAELVDSDAGPATSSGPPVLTVAASSLWRLEERLGWPIPPDGHAALLAATPGPPRLAETTPAHTAQTRRPEHRPWRASLVLLAHRPPATYGRLLADEPPARRWPHGTLVVDVLGVSWSTAGRGGPRAVAYRVTDRGEVVFAGDDAKLGHGHRPDSTAAVRVVLATVLARPSTGPGALGDRQRRLLGEHGRTLAAAALPADHPYPAGTRVRVQDPATHRQATGLVLAASTGRGGLVYRWRPDSADLPGHPWRDRGRGVATGPMAVALDRIASPPTGEVRVPGVRRATQWG